MVIGAMPMPAETSDNRRDCDGYRNQPVTVRHQSAQKIAAQEAPTISPKIN